MLSNGASNVIREKYQDVIPFLYPLKNREESSRVLHPLKPILPGNLFLENLLNYF
jgi:hypothetical protein